MNRIIKVAALLVGLYSVPAFAALKPGDVAPDFTVQAAVGGKDFSFTLSDALKKGPVVLYFYPKSFTSVCTIEAHLFADAAGKFTALGATLIGMSADSIEIQRDFSAKECRDKFPVAADPTMSTIRAYDAVWTLFNKVEAAMSDRISYVISPDGKILSSFASSAPEKHVETTLAAVKNWHVQAGK